MRENLSEQLAERIHIGTVRRICGLARADAVTREQLYGLMFCGESRVADNAAWVLTHFDRMELRWLEGRRDALAQEAMRTTSVTLCRLLLTLLDRLSRPAEVYPEFLDFCLSRIPLSGIPAGIRSLCIRLAYGQCRLYPELMEELCGMLELLEPDFLPPAVSHTRKKVLQDIFSFRRGRGPSQQKGARLSPSEI